MTDTITIQRFIDDAPISASQKRVVGLCFLIVALDGFDVGVLGFLAPSIAKEFGLGPGGLTPLFLAGMLGLIVGALGFGPLSDRFGRRPILIATTALFGTMCLLCSFAGSIETLILLRFLTGIGLGGAMPNAVALCSEFAPARRRASLITGMFCGFALAQAMAGLVSALLLPRFGWHGVLVVGGLAPLLLVPVLWKLLPESPRLLVLRGGREREVRATLERIATVPEGVRFTVDEIPAEAPVRQLFADGLGGGTALIWVTSFAGLLIVYLLGNWLPTLLGLSGFDPTQAALFTTFFHLGGATGSFLVGQVMDRFAHHKVIAVAFLGAMTSILIVGGSTGTATLVAAAILGTGFFVSAGQVGMNALAANHYPTSARATGVSWMHAIGRVGSVLGIGLGGMLMALGWQFGALFSLLAIPAVLGAGAVFGYGVLRRPRTER